jgi:hypothetical protein
MNDNLTIRDALTQPGGAFQIEYGGEFSIVAPANDVHEAITLLKSHRDRASIIQSVEAAIQEALPRIKSGEAGQQEAMDCAQDITIWFANEVLEGRKTLEQKNLKFLRQKEGTA